jgi:hypothetical protein
LGSQLQVILNFLNHPELFVLLLWSFKNEHMKKIIISLITILLLSSCSVFKSNKSGCPTNGKNIGAEKLASGDPKAIKAASKAGKLKGR